MKITIESSIRNNNEAPKNNEKELELINFNKTYSMFERKKSTIKKANATAE